MCMMNKYIGHPNQISGVEEMRLSGGKADNMRMLYIRNGKGLDFWISADRCADISRLSFKGVNYGYFSPCGYVAPQYYDCNGDGFLKSFTAGFMTTCGLTAVGSPCTDDGEKLPLHGTISNMPCENIYHYYDDKCIIIKAIIRDASLFFRKLVLSREYIVSLEKNEIILRDTVMNEGSAESPVEILYHCNIGYPLLDENAVIEIPAQGIEPRNAYAVSGIEDCLRVEKPCNGYEEMCFYHKLKGNPEISVFNPSKSRGMKLTYNAEELKCFTQWKMMGEYDYVMGLEPGNCYPDGRDVMRKKGMLEFLKPGQSKTYCLKFEFTEE